MNDIQLDGGVLSLNKKNEIIMQKCKCTVGKTWSCTRTVL